MAPKIESFGEWLSELRALIAGDPVCDADPTWIERNMTVLLGGYERGWAPKLIAENLVDRSRRGTMTKEALELLQRLEEVVEAERLQGGAAKH
jgi:hypothetical protein